MPKFDMKERKEPAFIKFVQGEVIEGVLLSIQKVEVGEEKKPASKYTCMDLESGELFAFLGTYEIDTKLRETDKGYYISVCWTGNEPGVSRNGNPLRRFQVRVSNQTAAESLKQTTGQQLADGTFITDNDIPF